VVEILVLNVLVGDAIIVTVLCLCLILIIFLKMTPKSTDPIANEIPCECGNKDHKAGLIIGKWGTIEEGVDEEKVKIQIFEGDTIKTVVINKGKLLEKLK